MPFSGRETLLQKLCGGSKGGGGAVDFADLAALEFLRRVAAPPVLSLRCDAFHIPPAVASFASATAKKVWVSDPSPSG